MKRRQQPRGTALIAVIVMMVLVGSAVVAMGALFATEVRRTRIANGGAQVRQMLLAADTVARDELNKSTTERDVPVATPVADGTLTLHIAPAADNKATIHAVAHARGAAASTMATYTHTDAGWTIESATLAGMQ